MRRRIDYDDSERFVEYEKDGAWRKRAIDRIQSPVDISRVVDKGPGIIVG
jgi:hypothetical protein